MKDKWRKIADMLWKVKTADRDFVLGTIALLKTEVQANMMIEYLKTVDLSTTKQTPIIREALYINDTY